MPTPKAEKVPRITTSVTLPAELAVKLRSEADERLVSPSLIVQRALEAYLPTLPSPDGSTEVAL